MNERVQKLQEIGATAAGDFIRSDMEEVITRRCDLDGIENEVDLKAAKMVRAILKEEFIDHLTPKTASSSEEPLVNQFD